MTRYLLDTTVLIDHSLGLFGATALIERLLGEAGDLFTCDVVVAEALSKGTDEQRALIDNVIHVLEYVSTTPDAARWAAAARRQRARHSSHRLADAVVAGVAWSLDAVIVTRNPKDFEGQGVGVLAYGPTAIA
jgi:predicted nucleic acid-binding protein